MGIPSAELIFQLWCARPWRLWAIKCVITTNQNPYEKFTTEVSWGTRVMIRKRHLHFAGIHSISMLVHGIPEKYHLKGKVNWVGRSADWQLTFDDFLIWVGGNRLQIGWQSLIINCQLSVQPQKLSFFRTGMHKLIIVLLVLQMRYES